MELREIRTFLKVAQLNSFSRAAKELGYSQAAVTIQVKQLEEELGTHLFDRIGKQTVLTHQGTIFYEYASSVMRDLACARDAVCGSRELTGRLTIGTIESICASIFPELLSKFHSLYPKVSVNIVLDSPDVLLDRMNKNAIDLVYLLDKRMYDQKWVKVFEEPEEVVFVAPAAHPYAKRKKLALEDVVASPFILTEKDASYRFVLDQYLASRHLKIEPFLEIGNTEFIIRLLLSGSGFSFLPEFSVRPFLNSGELAVLPVNGFHMRIWRQLLYHKDKWVTREMSAFIRLASDHCVIP